METISKEQLTMLNDARTELQQAQEAFGKAQEMLVRASGAYDFAAQSIVKSHKLTATDELNLETGVITRHPKIITRKRKR